LLKKRTNFVLKQNKQTLFKKTTLILRIYNFN